MNRSSLKFAAVAALVLSAGASLAAAEKRLVIENPVIADALASAGVEIKVDQIQPLTTPLSSSPNPKLTVESVIPGSDSLTARLRCQKTTICLPFLVTLRRDSNHESDAYSTAHPATRTLLVRNGKKATMLLQGSAFRMTLPVICLQNGARGELVRVISADRKRIFTARVTGNSLVAANENIFGTRD